MQKSPPIVHHFEDYKDYLNQRLDTPPATRGSRSALARAIGCQTAYVSNVLRGSVHFTPEQGEAINEHLGHSENEAEFFLLLLQLKRAGTEALRRRLRKQLARVKLERFDLKGRLKVEQTLSPADQAEYYSEWHYAAIHALASIPEFSTPAKIAARLGLEPAVAANAVEFLLRCGLLEQSGRGITVGRTQLHLGAESPLIRAHHANWRLRAVQKISRHARDNLHYSSVVTISKRDAEQVKELLIACIGNVKAVVRESKDECLQCFALDFFSV